MMCLRTGWRQQACSLVSIHWLVGCSSVPNHVLRTHLLCHGRHVPGMPCLRGHSCHAPIHAGSRPDVDAPYAVLTSIYR
jgi:hypothetical protein